MDQIIQKGSSSPFLNHNPLLYERPKDRIFGFGASLTGCCRKCIIPICGCNAFIRGHAMLIRMIAYECFDIAKVTILAKEISGVPLRYFR